MEKPNMTQDEVTAQMSELIDTHQDIDAVSEAMATLVFTGKCTLAQVVQASRANAHKTGSLSSD